MQPNVTDEALAGPRALVVYRLDKSKANNVVQPQRVCIIGETCLHWFTVPQVVVNVNVP